MIDVKEIAKIINKQGRQGPKDLKSQEVYNWISNVINISYEEYMRILDENAIHEDERSTNRNAFFIIENSGKYQLFKSREDEIRKYICYVVRENPNITSSEAKTKVKLLYKDFTIVDLMDQMNLSSKQDIIDQSIRNVMVSNYPRKNNTKLFYRSEDKPYRYTLKEEGYKLASEVDEILEKHKILDSIIDEETDSVDSVETIKGINYYSNHELMMIHEENSSFDFFNAYDASVHKKGRVPTDPKIKYTRFKQTNFCCEVNSEHRTFPTNSYPNYLEGHHLIPVSAQRNFPSIKLDCIENMVSLCPICHSQIHYGTREARQEVFNKIIESRIKDFESIGFTKQILKVIFDTYY